MSVGLPTKKELMELATQVTAAAATNEGAGWRIEDLDKLLKTLFQTMVKEIDRDQPD